MIDSRLRLGTPLTRKQRFCKRTLDIAVTSVALAALSWLIFLCWLAASFHFRKSGFFRQRRIGKNGRSFEIVKIRTMAETPDLNTSVTTAADPRLTWLGRFLRRTKLDEIPQLFNVLKGEMSLVGPRPDVPGYADRLEGGDRIILSVRPGMTGPASIRFRHEEALLALQRDPERFNREVLYREKVKLNRRYVENYSLGTDLRCLLATVLPSNLKGIDETEDSHISSGTDRQGT